MAFFGWQSNRDGAYHEGPGSGTGDLSMIDAPMDVDRFLLFVVLLAFAMFWLGTRAGATVAHERQRRLAKLRGRLNNIDPGDVTDSMLDKIEAALPTEKGKA
jgi:hypothetical protein